jgi:uncharacterized membrane protein
MAREGSIIEQKRRLWQRLYPFEILFIAVAVGLMGFGRTLWYDEAFSVVLVKQTYSDIISYTAGDVHPPLYYLILKIFTSILGQHWFVYHLVSLLPFLAMLLLIGSFCRKQFGEEAGMLSVLVVAGAPQILTYAMEIRMYSWCMFFVVLSAILAFEIYQEESRGKWLGLILVNTLAAYTHYFAGVAVILAALCLLFFLVKEGQPGRSRKVLHWGIAMGATALLYLPWLFVFYRQLKAVQQGYWIDEITVGTLQLYIEFIFGHDQAVLRYLLEILFILAVCGFLYVRSGRKEDQLIGMWAACFFGFIAVGILLSCCITPVFNKRYIIIVLPLLWMCLVCAFSRLKQKKIYVMLGLVGLLLFTVSYEKEFSHRTSESNQTLLSQLEKKAKAGEAVYSTSPYILADLAVYFPEMQQYISESALEEEAFGKWDEISSCEIVSDAETFCDQQLSVVWLLVYKDNDNTAEIFEDRGYELKDMGKKTIGWNGWNSDSIKVQVYRCTLPES